MVVSMKAAGPIRFDPDMLRAAVAEAEAEAREFDKKRVRALALADAYRKILALNDDGAPGLVRSAATVESDRFKEMTMAGAAHIVLSELAGHEMHGRSILEALAKGGRPIGGTQPMSSLQGALMRDA